MKSNKSNNSIIFLKDWKLLVCSMPMEDQLEFWDLFTSYEYGTVQICENTSVLPIWLFIKSQLDKMKEEYQNTVVSRNRENGAKGGRPKSETQKTHNNPVGLNETQKTPNENENVNEKDNDNDFLLEKETKGENQDFLQSQISEEKEIHLPVNPEIEKEKKVALKKEKFKPPSLQEVQEYCNERQNGIQAFTFVNFYQSKGWLIGKNPMKDWKAAIHTWESKNKENGTHNTKQSNSNGSGNSNGRDESYQGGKTSFNQILARKLSASGNSESGNFTIDAEVVE